MLPAQAFAAANPKSGASCTKSGIIKEFQNKKFTCIKVNKKLVWNKGSLVVKPAVGIPVSEPIQQPIPTGPQEVTQKYLPSGCHARVSATLQLKNGSNWKDLGGPDGW